MQYFEKVGGTDGDANVKQVIFLVVFIAMVAVPLILSILTKKKADNEKDKGKT